MRPHFFVSVTVIGLFVACSSKEKTAESSSFTSIDSLTETYLTLEDSVMNSWNALTADENEKMRSLTELLQALVNTHRHDEAQLDALEQRLDQLGEMQIDHENLSDPHIIEEYDFASNSLVNEILTLAESDSEFHKDESLQRLVDQVKVADQHIPIFRADYDSAAARFNDFLKINKQELDNLDASLSRELKPLF